MLPSVKAAFEKAAQYCTKQERCHQEVRNKLYDWGSYADDVEQIISELITNNFLNEERYAHAFATGKFRQKRWGKRKIYHGLRAKKVAEVLIKEALAAIPEEEYLETIRQVATKRSRQERSLTTFIAKQRIINYVVQRGFEPDLVRAVLDEGTLDG